MKKFLTTIFASITFLSFSSSFYVVGYIPTYRMTQLNNLNFDFYTHIVASFINPDEAGNISWSGDIDLFASKMHAEGVKAIASFGGGGDYSWGGKVYIYEDHLATAASRTNLVHQFMNYVREHNLDGLDNDMEGSALALDNYDIFTQELGDSLHAGGFEFSAAYGVGGSWGGDIVDNATLAKFDFIGTMSYGGVSKWNWRDRENFMSFDKFKNDVDYFIGRGMNPSKVLGGVAFYTNEFPSTEQTNYGVFNQTICNTYKDSRAGFPEILYQDTLNTPEGHVIYLNGIPTFKRKIDYASENGGGIMVWEVGQECFDGTVSLSDTLNEYLKSKSALTSYETQKEESLKVFPNPTSGTLFIKQDNVSNLILYDLSGRVVHNAKKSGDGLDKINLSHFNEGTYFLQLVFNNYSTSSVKIVVKN